MPSSPDHADLPTYEALALPHLERLRAFARRRDPVEADDLVQEALLRGWQRFGELREVGAIRAWLFQILHNLFLQERRVRRRRMELLPITSLEGAHEERVRLNDITPLEELVSRRSSAAVRQALSRLPDEFAVAVELHDLDGFRYREIATITGVPIGTVMSRISRGRRLLASLLVQWGAEAHEAGASSDGSSQTVVDRRSLTRSEGERSTRPQSSMRSTRGEERER